MPSLAFAILNSVSNRHSAPGGGVLHSTQKTGCCRIQ